jgi:hypothetical protein
MKGVDIVNRLKEILPKYTEDFSEMISILSLTRSGSTVTATTSANHNLSNGNYVTIKGAKEQITITSMVYADGIMTVTTATDHKLSDPSLYSNDSKPNIEISGVIPVGYNGTFKLNTVPDSTTFTYQVSDSGVVTTLGKLLLPDFDGYNGYKQITVTGATTFTYSIASNPQSPAAGTIKLSNATRVGWSATPERIVEFYSEDQARTLQKWMFVVVGSKTIYKNDTVASDLSTAKRKGEIYHFDSQQNFSIFVFVPSQNDVLGGDSSDTARSYEKPILKSLANYRFISTLEETLFEPATYVGNESEDYLGAFYVHRFDFLSKGYIYQEDVAEEDQGVPLQVIDGNFQDPVNMIFKPRFR